MNREDDSQVMCEHIGIPLYPRHDLSGTGICTEKRPFGVVDFRGEWIGARPMCVSGSSSSQDSTGEV